VAAYNYIICTDGAGLTSY